MSTRTPLHGLYDFSCGFHEQAEFLQLYVPVFGSAIHSVSCDNSDAVVKVKDGTQCTESENQVCFFSDGTLSRQAICVSVFCDHRFRQLKSTLSSNVFDAGVHFPRQVICASESPRTLKDLSWVSGRSEDFTISGHSASLSMAHVLKRPCKLRIWSSW